MGLIINKTHWLGQFSLERRDIEGKLLSLSDWPFPSSRIRTGLQSKVLDWVSNEEHLRVNPYSSTDTSFELSLSLSS